MTSSEQKLYLIEIRNYFNCMECPDEGAVSAALKSIFPADPALVIKPMDAKMLGCYEVAATTEPSDDGITLPRKKRGTNEHENIKIPLGKHKKSGQGERREGTLVTIVGADFGPAHVIPGRDFDEVMAKYGNVIMPTKPQVNKQTDTYNGNRMCVVKNTNSSVPLPNRIEVAGKSFLIKYQGKRWYCSSCSEEHTGACPYLKNFYEALEKKKAMEINSCVLADSTLRLAEHVGLKADIKCMPGATVGQLAQAIDEDSSEKYNCYHIAAGCNDTSIKHDTDPYIVAKKIDSSIKKLAKVAKKHQNTKSFVFYNTTQPKVQKSPIQHFADSYFKNRMRKVLQKDTKVCKAVKYKEEWVDGHPSEEDTERMIKKIAPDLIVDKKFLTSKRLYKGVTKVYVSGCSGCDQRGYFSYEGFCKSCLDSFSRDSKFEDYELLTKIKRQAFNENVSLEQENEKKKEGKRKKSYGSSDDCPDVKCQIID